MLFACGVVAAAISASTLAQGQDAGRPSKQPGKAQRAVVAESQADSSLVEILELIAKGRTREALPKAAALTRKHPNFQLAQLVYGDLLLSRARPMNRPGEHSRPSDAKDVEGAETLAGLRDEARLRVLAQRRKPPAGTIPSQFATLAPGVRHAIAIDASQSRLYLLRNTASGLTLVADYYISLGKLGFDKSLEGDRRTPLGVYFVTSHLPGGTLTDFYGAGALPISYPNPYDVKRGKSGSGIWLHGTPSNQFSRAPLATDGCVVLTNEDLRQLLDIVQVGATPVVIAPALSWVKPENAKAANTRFEQTMAEWRSAKSSGDLTRLLTFYSSDFSSRGKNLADWLPALRGEIQGAAGREFEIKDVSYLHWADTAETMVVTFGQVVKGERTGVMKRQYWIRKDQQWKIFFEGDTA